MDRHGASCRALAVCGVYLALGQLSVLLALVWNVLVLYLTLGFRQFSHYFTDIRDALERGDELTARRLLAEWRHLDASELPRTELLRHVIEHSLLAAHRHVFGVFFWFVVLSTLGLGPAGAVLYRMAEFASRYWAYKSRTRRRAGQRAAACAVAAPVRHDRPRAGAPHRVRLRGGRQLRGGGERLAARRRPVAHANEGIILAAAAGAVGVQLGGSAARRGHARPLETFETGAPT